MSQAQKLLDLLALRPSGLAIDEIAMLLDVEMRHVSRIVSAAKTKTTRKIMRTKQARDTVYKFSPEVKW